MKKPYRALLAAAGLLMGLSCVEAAQLEGIKWQEGPAKYNLGEVATIQVPAGYVFAGAKDTRSIMEALHNPVSGSELGFVAPASREWFIVFEFDDVGYVRDDEKRSIDPEAILRSIKAGTEAGNKERRRRGWAEMNILGWQEKPHYNETTHHLEWAINAESQGRSVINYNTRLLGRGGVMRVTLVTGSETLAATVPTFKNVLGGFGFTEGHRYAEYRQGDKVAKYGLTALMVGGATAVALKSGMFKGLGKIIVVAFVAVAAFFKRLVFGGRSSE